MSDRVPAHLAPTTASLCCQITPETLAAAPELAVLALLDETLRVTRAALLATQPALVGEPPAWRVDVDLIAARRLLHDAAKLEQSIVRYRQCVLRALHEAPDRDDDLPF
jgi:hypothetical protein